MNKNFIGGCFFGIFVGVLSCATTMALIYTPSKQIVPEVKELKEFGQFAQVLWVNGDEVTVSNQAGTERWRLSKGSQAVIPGDYWLLAEVDGKIEFVHRLNVVQKQPTPANKDVAGLL